MTPADFIYHFTDIFFSEAVKETILIENWEESDFDHRYVEYADVFIKIKKECLESDLIDGDVLATLTHHKNHIVTLFNTTMGKHFKNEIMQSSGVDSEKANQLLPKDIFFDDKVNINALRIFREFEEKFVKPKQGEGK
jgi:glycine cleavage system protein P-like pyridoxal-binding family